MLTGGIARVACGREPFYNSASVLVSSEELQELILSLSPKRTLWKFHPVPQFKFIGDMGAYFFFWSVGEEVIPHEEWQAARKQA